VRLRVILILLVCVCSMISGGGRSASGQAVKPGTTGDPLVTKSYLDLMCRFRALVVPSGQTVRLSGGALVVVRSGTALLKAGPKKAIVDLTAGTEIKAGATLPHFHLLLIPDGGPFELHAKDLTLLMAVGQLPDDKNP
jgi:hypothetical protein